MAHFYVNTIVLLTTLQTITVPRQRMTQCEQWNNEGFFPSISLPLFCCLEEKKDPYRTKKRTGVIVFWVCDSEMLSIVLFIYFSLG